MGFYGLLQLIYPLTGKAVDGQDLWRPTSLAIISHGAVLKGIFLPHANRIFDIHQRFPGACGAGNAQQVSPPGVGKYLILHFQCSFSRSFGEGNQTGNRGNIAP